MKFKSSALIIMTGAMISASASANILADVYVGATIGAGGASIYDDGHTHSTSAQSFGAMFGVDIPVLRVEAEYSYLRQSDMSLNIGSINAYAKMPSTLIQPYFGVGIGVAFDSDFDDNPDVKIDNPMTYAGMLGLTFTVPALPIKADIEARTMYIPDLYKYTSANGKEISPDALHYDLRLKLRYIF